MLLTSGIVDTAQTAVETGLQSVSTAMGTTLAAIIPIALGIVGAVMVVTFGIGIFGKLTGKRG